MTDDALQQDADRFAGSGLVAALAKVQAKLPEVKKAATVTKSGVSKAGVAFSFDYGYAKLEDVTAAIFPLLGAEGLAWVTMPTFHEGKFVLRYQLMHSSGESIGGEFPLPSGGDPQTLGSHITYARRYTLCAVTGIAPEDDDDAQVAQAARQQVREQPAGTMAQRRPRASRKPEGEAGRGRREGGDGEALAGRGAAPPSPGERKPNPNDPWNDKQRGKLFALLGKAGVKDDRDERLAFCSRLLQLPEPLTTSNQLTFSQAGHLIDNLERTGPRQSDQDIDDYVTLVLFGGNPYTELTEEQFAAEVDGAVEQHLDEWEPEWP